MIYISKTVRRSATIGVGAALLMGGLAACGSSSDTVASTAAGGTTTGTGTGPVAPAATATPTPAPAKLQIKKNAVSPAKLTVTPGEKVQIVNSDSVAHELVDSKDKISSGNIKTDSTGALIAPTKAGTFELIDPNHSGIKLTLVVS